MTHDEVGREEGATDPAQMYMDGMHGEGARATGMRGVDDDTHVRAPLGGKTVPPYVRVSCAEGGPGSERWRREMGISEGKAGEFFRIFRRGAALKISWGCWMGG